jgi:hypothetical protein
LLKLDQRPQKQLAVLLFLFPYTYSLGFILLFLPRSSKGLVLLVLSDSGPRIWSKVVDGVGDKLFVFGCGSEAGRESSPLIEAEAGPAFILLYWGGSFAWVEVGPSLNNFDWNEVFTWVDADSNKDSYSARVRNRPACSISIGLAVRGWLLIETRSIFQGDGCQVDVMKKKKKKKKKKRRSNQVTGVAFSVSQSCSGKSVTLHIIIKSLFCFERMALYLNPRIGIWEISLDYRPNPYLPISYA